MSEQTDNYVKLLTPFGLNELEAEIYLLLVRKGVLSALQISREIHAARTRVYRILDKLIEKKMVTVNLDDMGKKFEANSYQELEILLVQKEAEVARLKQSLPETFNQLAQLWGKAETSSKVLYYKGKDGLAQVTWNSLRASDLLRIYEVEQDMSAFLDEKFSEKVRQELVDRQITTHQLTNKKRIEPHTKVAELPRKFWQVRYLDPKKLGMQFECLIYNDVFALYNFKGEDQFCVEIYNDKLATMQKQIFDFVWKNSKPMRIIGEEGEAILR